jgi:hypothetical protein
LALLLAKTLLDISCLVKNVVNAGWTAEGHKEIDLKSIDVKGCEMETEVP